MGCAHTAPAPANLRGLGGIAVPEGCTTTPTVCPGYTTRLPEVIEAARARLHWSKGSLDHFVRGYATEQLVIAIEIGESTSNEVQSWAMDNPVKKGGS